MNRAKLIAIIVFIVVVILAGVIAGVVVAVYNARKPFIHLSFEPTPPDSDDTLIWYKSSDINTISYWTKRLDTFLEPYTKSRHTKANIIQCESGIPPETGSNKFCDVRMNYWMPCDHNYGYNFNSSVGGPCIFLTPNKSTDMHNIFLHCLTRFKNPEWVPEYYNLSTIPNVMPDYLKQTIRDLENRYGDKSNRLKVLWVSCEGENPADAENIGPIIYMPMRGFDGAYFPVINKEDYLRPLIAIYFEKPMHGVLINIQCKAWARNIKHEEEEGLVHFELMVD